MATFGGRTRCESGRSAPSCAPALPGIFGGLALVAALGCAAVFQAPEVSVVGLDVVSLGITGGTASVRLSVSNPNDRAVRVNGLRYRLRVEDPETGDGGWRTLSEGFRSESVTLEARDTVRIAVDVPFEYRAVGAAVRSLIQGRDVGYRLDGEVRIAGPVGEIRVPVTREGVLQP